MNSLELLLIAAHQKKRPPFKTYIIHCSYDESLLISLVWKKKKDFDSLKEPLETQRDLRLRKRPGHKYKNFKVDHKLRK